MAACGRRWGKTAVGLLSVLRGHGPARGVRRGALDGGTVWWVAPTYGVAAKIWRDLKRACRGGWTAKSETERRIELPGAGCVEVHSADAPDHLRGEGLDGVVFDEAAFIPEKVWRDVLRPALSDKQGWAMFLSTPNGKNWFYELTRAAKEDAAQGAPYGVRGSDCGLGNGPNGRGAEGWHGLVDEPTTPSSHPLGLSPSNPQSEIRKGRENACWGWEAWVLPTSQNPLISAAELEEARRQLGLRAFAQEYEAHFLDLEGAEFSGAYFDDSIWFDRWPDEREVRLRIMALDPSKGRTDRADYSAFVLMVVDAEGTMWIDADLARRDVRQIIDDGLRLARDFRPDAFGVEANQFQEVLADIFAERSRELNLRLPLWSMTNVLNKQNRIRATLTPHLARGEFRFLRPSPGARLLVEQLIAFPAGDYDDGPDALEMAVRLAKRLTATSDETVQEQVIA